MKKIISLILAVLQIFIAGGSVLAAEDEYLDGEVSVGGFSFSGPADAKITYELTEENAYQGNSLHIVKKAGVIPNVYGILRRYVPVKANTTYQYSMWIKSKEADSMEAAVGWTDKKNLLPLGATCDWINLKFEYENTGGDTNAEFMIILNGSAKDLYFDNIEFREMLPDGSLGENLMPEGDFDEGKSVSSQSKYEAENIRNEMERNGSGSYNDLLKIFSVDYAVPAFKGTVTPDGDLSDWDFDNLGGFFLPSKDVHATSVIEYSGEDDLSGDFRICYDDENYYVAGKVTDDKPSSANNEFMWQEDSIQINFGKRGTEDMFGYGIKYTDDGGELTCYSGDAEEAKSIKFGTSKDGQKTYYEAAIPKNIIFDGNEENLTFNILINDNDGEGRAAYLQWQYGIGEGAGSEQFGQLLLVPDEDDVFAWISAYYKTVEMGVPVELPIWIVNRSDSPKTVLITDNNGETETEIPAKSAVLRTVSAQTSELGYDPLGVKITVDGKEKEVAVIPSSELSSGHYEEEFDNFARNELAQVKALMEQCEAEGIVCDYEKADLFVLERFVQYGKDDANNGKKTRAEYVLNCLKDIAKETTDTLNAYLEGTKVPHITSKYVTSDITTDGVSFMATDDSGRERPMFFRGYGHFTQVREDMPYLSDLGANIIEMEIGPQDVIKGEDENGFIVDTSYTTGYLQSIFQKAEENNVAINLLLSPHYLPAWYQEKYPEDYVGYFTPTDKMRELLEAYVRAVIPIVKDSPALHSICLMNEPSYNTTANSALNLPEYHSFLTDLFENDIDKLNDAYGTEYKAFSEVQFPDVEELQYNPDKEENKKYLPQYCDWHEFNDQYFANWCKWMYDIILDIDPTILAGTKIMQNYDGNEREWRRQFLNFGTDPETLGAMLTINGNDANNYYKDSLWGILNKMSFYDMQTSVLDAPVFDFEDHVILDRDRTYEGQPFKENHVAADIWQGAIHGKGASTIWVWERTYDDASDFSDSILHRPDVLRNASYAMLDVGRLAYELTALEKEKRTVGLLYSKTSRVYSMRNSNSMVTAYEAASYLGERIEFVTEKQAGAGKLTDSDVNLLVVPFSPNVLDGAIEGIADFIRNGGKVVIVGEESLSYNQHNKPLDAETRNFVFENSTVVPAVIPGAGEASENEAWSEGTSRDTLESPSAKQLWETLKNVKNTLEDEIPVLITDAINGSVIWGVNYTTAIYNDRLLINICDYDYNGGKVIDVRYNGEKIKQATELRSEETISAEGIVLEPYVPILLSVPLDELPQKQPEFSDMEGHWARYAVYDLANEGVIEGMSAEEFVPDEKITVKDFEALLARLLGKDDNAFDNVISAEDRPITREEMAYLLVNAYEGQGKELPEGDLSEYIDAADTKYPEEMACAEALGFILGTGGSMLSPKNNATRAEAASVIMRFDKIMQGYRYVKQDGTVYVDSNDELKIVG